MNIKEIIEITVNETVKKLQSERLIKEKKLSTYKKAEKFLYNYPMWKKDPEAVQMCGRIEKALKAVENDYYFEIIKCKYFNKMTLEQIAEIFDINTSVVSRHRQRLVNEIKGFLFPEEYVKEIIGNE